MASCHGPPTSIVAVAPSGSPMSPRLIRARAASYALDRNVSGAQAIRRPSRSAERRASCAMGSEGRERLLGVDVLPGLERPTDDGRVNVPAA